MANCLDPLIGENFLEHPIDGCQVSYDGENQLTRLVLSVASRQPTRSQSRAATTLELHLERDAAMALLLELHRISNAVGWPLQEATGGQGGVQRYVSTGPHSTPKHTR